MRSLWFGPAEIKILTSVLDDALRTLRLGRDDPAALIVAKRIIDLARLGELDPVRLRDYALEIDRPPCEGKHARQITPDAETRSVISGLHPLAALSEPTARIIGDAT
jgi:hypothetical protein